MQHEPEIQPSLKRFLPLIFAIGLMLALPFALLGYAARDLLQQSNRDPEGIGHEISDRQEVLPPNVADRDEFPSPSLSLDAPDPLQTSLETVIKAWKPNLDPGADIPEVVFACAPDAFVAIKENLLQTSEERGILVVELDRTAPGQMTRLLLSGDSLNSFIMDFHNKKINKIDILKKTENIDKKCFVIIKTKK